MVTSPRPILLKLALGLGAILLIAVTLFAAYIWLAFQYSYSDGERAGFIQKFSRKGWLCKTWEGELALVAMPGSTPEKFFFTVRDGELAARINTLMGQRVAVVYAQHKGLPGDCFGETEYFVREIKAVGP
jgi:hypothetical protein